MPLFLHPAVCLNHLGELLLHTFPVSFRVDFAVSGTNTRWKPWEAHEPCDLSLKQLQRDFLPMAGMEQEGLGGPRVGLCGSIILSISLCSWRLREHGSVSAGPCTGAEGHFHSPAFSEGTTRVPGTALLQGTVQPESSKGSFVLPWSSSAKSSLLHGIRFSSMFALCLEMRSS